MLQQLLTASGVNDCPDASNEPAPPRQVGHFALVGRNAPELRLEDGTRLGDLMREGRGVALDFSTDRRLNDSARGWDKRIRYVAGPARKTSNSVPCLSDLTASSPGQATAPLIVKRSSGQPATGSAVRRSRQLPRSLRALPLVWHSVRVAKGDRRALKQLFDNELKRLLEFIPWYGRKRWIFVERLVSAHGTVC
nr:hypothetical protein [Streptomyces sp. Ag109_G2-15]